jgi:hypothetical protein
MISNQVQEAISQCDLDTPDCIADALDNYAAALQELAPQLPPALRSLPMTVARAAARVRRSQTKQEAVRAVKMAIAEIHKTIALLKAEDGSAHKAETRAGVLVAQTLQVADNKLQRAVGL